MFFYILIREREREKKGKRAEIFNDWSSFSPLQIRNERAYLSRSVLINAESLDMLSYDVKSLLSWMN